MKKLLLLAILTVIGSVAAPAQLKLPRESQRQEIVQTVGDTRIAITYDRPNVKGRTNIFGCESTDVVPKSGVTYPCLVPNGQVWRTGANENTVVEVSNEVKINGNVLPAGKYGLHTIPGKDEWTIIFSKDNDKWGSYSYDASKDQLRVKVKPMIGEMSETMSLGFENVRPAMADIVVRWEKVRVPFTVDIGDMQPRVLNYIREQMKNVKADDFSSQPSGARYVFDNKITASYDEAIGWLDAFLKKRETPGALGLKANLLAETGKTAEAIAAAEKALQIAATMNPKPNTSALEKKLAEWKAKK
jgi:Protein of unknown function (DUF2911)